MNTHAGKLLIVDDEMFNREFLAEMLAGAGYTVEMAGDGEEAWEMLDAGKYDFSAVLLDRMMPRLDGMGLLARMKADKRFADMPVIFQTAIDQPQDVAAGIKAGAYYYLVKPVDEDVLLAIVHSAVSAVSLPDSVQKQGGRNREDLSRLLLRSEFQLRTLPEARALATALSRFYPHPQRAYIGIAELLINAVEHGNLGITYQEKSQLLHEGGWEAEIDRRLALPENANKVVEVHLEHKPGEICLTIRDCGKGFESSPYMEIAPERAFDPNGRGIAMTKMMSFDALEYRGNGNQLVAIVKI